MRKFSVLFFCCAALAISACNTPPEQLAYKVEVSAAAFLHSVEANHPECGTSKTVLCEYLSRATAAQHALADAIDVYCAGPDFNAGGKCNAPAKGTPLYSQAIDKLNAAVAGYEQIESDLKAAIKGGTN